MLSEICPYKPTFLNPDEYEGGVLAGAEKEYLLWTIEEVNKNFPKERLTFLEIGIYQAGTSEMMVRAINKLKMNALYIGVDPFEKNPRHKNADHSWWAKRIASLKGTCSTLLLKDFSQKVTRKIPNKLNWVFIDGCHCSLCLRDDLDNYSGRIKPGGILNIHDVGGNFRNSKKQRFKQRTVCLYYKETKSLELDIALRKAETDGVLDKFDILFKMGIWIPVEKLPKTHGTMASYIAKE